MRLRPKPALVLITADWCMYCRMQKNQLKKNRELQRALSQVYFTELDAETTGEVVFNDKTYRFFPTGVATGRHELAFALGEIDNRLSIPTWVLLNEHFEIIFKFPGVIKASELSRLLESLGKNLE
ncbi:thioredoxin fold domain-containing protein [Parapedobacter sp.]